MKILIVEDDKFTNRMLEKYLIDLGFDVVTALDGSQGWDIFCQGNIHFVVTDWMMPELSGPELINKIREKEEKTYCYIILLTAKNNQNEIVEGISGGADDYIVKPFNKEELAVRVRAGQRIVELHQELFEANAELKKLSITDPLTGLYNRRALSDYLKQRQSNPKVSEDPCGFIMADIDKFKRINDTYGHDAGDFVLIEVVERIKKILPDHEMISRIGGEEFFVVLTEMGSKQAEATAEKIRKYIELSPVVLPDMTEVFVTCSFGVFCVESFSKWEYCMKMADQALYESKNSGRNKVTMYESESEK